MKKSQDTTDTVIPEELEIVIIIRSNGISNKEIKLKLPSETTFDGLISFLFEQKLLASKRAIVRPSQKESQIISHSRKIQECYNVIKLSFIIE